MQPWVAYVKLLNLEIRHLVGRDNFIVDMLPRARYRMEAKERNVEEELDFFKMAPTTIEREGKYIVSVFKEDEYEGE